MNISLFCQKEFIWLWLFNLSFKDEYGLIGNGLCRTECPKDNYGMLSLCIVNGYRKKSSSYEECKSTCDKESACTGFSITDSHRSYPIESNLCYVYGNLSNFDSMNYWDYNQLPFDVKRNKDVWVHYPVSNEYFKITMSEHRVKNARCFKKLKWINETRYDYYEFLLTGMLQKIQRI